MALALAEQRGFTLIELLVVIAIIGVLASVVLASLNSARSRGNDANKVSALRELQKALELYYSDHGSYPSTASAWRSGTTVCNATYGSGRSYTGANGYIPNLAPTYISVLPEVPNVGGSKCFLYRSDGTNYKLLIFGAMENYDADSPLADPGYGGTAPNCTNDRNNTYAVYSPGAICW